MTYEPGTYLKELRQAHQNGEHVEDEDNNCPVCNYQVVPEGFDSLAEYHEALHETAAELQVYVDAHFRGEHKTKSEASCIECSREE